MRLVDPKRPFTCESEEKSISNVPGLASARASKLRAALILTLAWVMAGHAAAVRAEEVDSDPWATVEEYGSEERREDADAADETDADEDIWSGVEALFVESARRLVDLQDASEALTTFSGADLRDQGIVDFGDLQYSVPNLFTGGGLSRTTLRGVGSEIVGPGTDPGFAVHTNGVYTVRSSTGSSDYFDIERIDVLRGPQGTLWGRNSTGGAINVVTARPIFDYDSAADLEYESFAAGAQGIRMRGMFNIPLVEDKLAARFAFLTYFNDGLTENEGPSGIERINDEQTYSLRFSLRWQPNDRLTVDYIGTLFRSVGSGQVPKFTGDFFSPGRVPEAGVGPGANYSGALPNPRNRFRSATDGRNDADSTIYTASLLAEYEGDAFQLQSISGYQSSDFSNQRDLDGSSLAISTLDLKDSSRQVSQEILIHSTWEHPVDYTFGAIYQYDWTPQTSVFVDNVQNTANSANFRLSPFVLFTSLVDDCGIGMTASCPPTKPIGVIQEDFVRAFSRVDNHVLGLYGNVTWEVVDDLRLSAGARFSYTHRKWDDKTRVQSFSAISPTTGLLVLQLGQAQKESWQSGTWKLTADYRILESHLLWASVGTGARAGGFNFVDENSFGQERILAVEAGFKSSFLDRRITLNVSGFWYDWEDPQIRGTADNLPITTNAPSASSYGIEVETRIALRPEIAVNASFGWLEATYDRQFFDLDRTIPDFSAPIQSRFPSIDIEGNRLPRSPRFNASIGVEYTHDLADHGTLTPRVDFYYRSETSFRQFDNPRDEQKAYTRTDVRMTWRSPSEQLWVELFMRNLEDARVKTNQDIYDNIYRLHYYDSPRSGGIRVGYEY